MRKDRQAASAMNQADRVGNTEAVLRDVRGTPVPEVLLEGFAKVQRPATRDHRARHVRAANGAASRMTENGIDGDGDLQRIETLDDPDGARESHLTQLDQPVFELPELAEVQPEDVRLGVTFHRAELDA